ncbi:hypothetical protein SAMN05518856_101399 [Paenibacillus sp. OK003]|nr:hypothetical protein SAMN05518856_101399 [Paenibacillus sp. OK003]
MFTSYTLSFASNIHLCKTIKAILHVSSTFRHYKEQRLAAFLMQHSLYSMLLIMTKVSTQQHIGLWALK